MSSQNPVISVVVPCYNEEEVLVHCHSRLTQVLASMEGTEYELVYVNDGSSDRTEEILRYLNQTSPQARVVMLSRNFGHQAAVTAGLTAATGQCLVIIDADLQDPPEVILQMVEKWREGYEVVYGIRETRAGESGFKLRSAQLFYRLINKLSDVNIPLDTGDFRLLDRRAAEALLAMPERHRLLRGMASWIGFRQYGLKYAREARFAGSTKYPLRKMFNLFSACSRQPWPRPAFSTRWPCASSLRTGWPAGQHSSSPFFSRAAWKCFVLAFSASTSAVFTLRSSSGRCLSSERCWNGTP
jgi:glycosyltransferase involved in cell wall biosynthesis